MIFSRDFNCLWAFEVHFKFNVFCGIDLSGFDEFRNLIHVCVDAWLDLGTKPQNKKKRATKHQMQYHFIHGESSFLRWSAHNYYYYNYYHWRFVC